MNEPFSTTAPPKPDPAVLEKRWLHNVMVLLTQTDRLPSLVNLLGLLAVVALHARLWRLVTKKVASLAVSLLTGAAIFDLISLWLLPRRDAGIGNALKTGGAEGIALLLFRTP
jgi:hypothetical protein